MPTRHEIADLFRKDPLRDHPLLERFPREEAMLRLKAYQAEAAASLGPLRVVHLASKPLVLVGLAVACVADIPWLVPLFWLSLLALLVLEYLVTSRTKRIVARRVQEELAGQRLTACLHCGYTFHGLDEAQACPECGAERPATPPIMSDEELARARARRRNFMAKSGAMVCVVPPLLALAFELFTIGAPSYATIAASAACGVGLLLISLQWLLAR